MNKRKGFTLVELLVVIAIIALLMGILLPALARVRRAAKSSACMVQMKQWGTIYSMYTGDFDGFFCGDYDISGGRKDWWKVMEPYYKDLDLLTCPAATKIRAYDDQAGAMNSTDEDYDEGGKCPFSSKYMGKNDNGEIYEISVSYNGWVGEAENPSRADGLKRYAAWRWATVNRIKTPTFVPIMGDTVWHSRKFVNADVDPKVDYPNPDVNVGSHHHDRIIDFRIRRHGPKTNPNINMAFADFSVRAVGLKALWSLKWHKNWIQQRKENAYTKKMSDPSVWPDWMKDYSSDGVTDVQ